MTTSATPALSSPHLSSTVVPTTWRATKEQPHASASSKIFQFRVSEYFVKEARTHTQIIASGDVAWKRKKGQNGVGARSQVPTRAGSC
jgi:hypothetical protein